MTRGTIADRASAQGAIEGYIDVLGLEQVLDLIAGICQGKADHLRLNQQADYSAGFWERARDSIDGLTPNADIRTVSQ